MPDRIGTEQFGRVPRLIACGVRNRNQNAAPSKGTFMATPGPARPKVSDWTKPAAMAIPKEGYFTLEQGRYGPIFPKTPANYGFTLIAKVKPGREEATRAHGKTIENAIAGNPSALAPLRLHYLRW